MTTDNSILKQLRAKPLPANPLEAREIKAKKRGLFYRLVQWIWQRLGGDRSKAEERERLAEEREAKEQRKLYSLLRDEGYEYAKTIRNTLTRKGVCYRYTVREREEEFERVQEIHFERPLVVSKEVIKMKLDTRNLPRGIGCKELEDEDVLKLLSFNCRRRVTVHHTIEGGWWLWVEREFGMGGLPRHIAWSEMVNARPAHLAGERLAFPLGIGENRKPVWRKVPESGNMLIAGSPDGGKSNFANAVICTLLKHNKPNQLKLLLVDLKGGLEFNFYAGLSDYLLQIPKPKPKDEKSPKESAAAETDDDEEQPEFISELQVQYGELEPEDDEEIEYTDEMMPAFIEERTHVPAALNWLINEAERRMEIIKKSGCKKIQQYNAKMPVMMPYVICVIDEWADVKLDRALGARCEDMLINITNRARATGIYAYVATQSPNKDVLSIRVKNAMNSRMVFRCADQYMSQGLVGDYSASKIEVQGRGYWINGRDRLELQTPYIPNEQVDAVVAEVQGGRVTEIVKPKRHDVQDREIFEWALKENDGRLGGREVFATFQARKMTFRDAQSFVRSWVGKVVSVGGNDYRLEPGGPGKPSRLLPIVLPDSIVTSEAQHA